jgi:type I restriction enzyme R subunit
VVDFVGVLRDLRKALQFDSADVSGVIEDLELLLRDLLARLEAAGAEYLEADGTASPDERLEALVYGRLLDPVRRKEFFESYKAIEALWEIVSPAPELRDLIPIYRSLAQLYATVRNAYSEPVGYVADLAYKTKRLVQESVVPYGLGQLTRTVTFDVATIEGLRANEGSDEAKIFNLVRGLRREIEEAPGASPVLQSLKDRAERILRELEGRRTEGLAAMDQLEALAREKEEASRAAAESGLTPRGLGVFWSLKDEPTVAAAGISALELARQAEDQLSRFPNAALNAEEQRRLRAALYQPLLRLEGEERGRIVDLELRSLLDGHADGDT